MQLKMKQIAIIILMLICSICKAQDSTSYYQKDAVLFSNKYTFFSDGTFKHFFMTDDLQVWYGSGKYVDKGKYRTLYFKDADTTMYEYKEWILNYETNFQRVLVKKQFGFKSFEKNLNTGKPRVKLKEIVPNKT